MSRKGDCWDNAVAESFFGSLKVERVFGVTYFSRSVAKQEIIDYNETFYNSRRRYSSLGSWIPWNLRNSSFGKKRLINVYFYLTTSVAI